MTDTTTTVIATSPEETALAARRLAPALKPGMIVCLMGDLGAGKSVFARALAGALGVTDPMPSPTFTIVHEYLGSRGLPVLHVDLYRLSGEDEFFYLGIEESMEQAITIVEWPERAPSLLERAHVSVTITVEEDTRTIAMEQAHARPGN